MTDLANRGSMGLKGAVDGQIVDGPHKDPAYLADLHLLPCVICKRFALAQQTPTQAHHTICGRFSSEKTPDGDAIPLCEGHHQGMFDTSKIAIHRQRAEWERRYGLDTDYIAVTQAVVKRLRGWRI